jgi:hypothetical protein
VSWTSIGGVRADVTNIPTPFLLPNIVARILAFTGAGGDLFYYTTGLSGSPQMQVFDNSVSSYVVDFSDTALLAGIEADYLFNLVELGECAGVAGYSDRLFWWGERAKMPNWRNPTFDGGWDPSSNGRPLGWQRASVAALEQDVPAAQIFLGVANYAYAWRPHHVDSLFRGDRPRKRARVRARLGRTRTNGTLRPRRVRPSGRWTASHWASSCPRPSR